MNRYEALYKFFSQFGIPAYTESSVPAQAKMPYLTYEPVEADSLDGEVNMTVNLWYCTTSEAEPNDKALEIGKVIGRGGVTVKHDTGVLWLKKGRPWCQAIPDEDPLVKRRYLNVSVESISID